MPKTSRGTNPTPQSHKTPRRHVIIGNSVAGLAAAETIRRHDPASEITVVSEETHRSYARPLISYYLAGKVNAAGLVYRAKSFFDENRIETVLGERVTRIAPGKRKVTLESGRQIGYDKLLLATGGTPIVPPLPGVDRQGVTTFTTLADADTMRRQLPALKHVVVVGGGLIGLKVAEALRQRDVSVTIVELMDRVLAPVLDETAAEIVSQVFRDHGADIITGTSVTEILPRLSSERRVGGVRLSDGREIHCDAVVMAVGVRPRTELAQAARIKVNRGILVDEHLRTSSPHIFAAGDTSEGYDSLLGETRPLPIWPNAYWQGQVAGANMAGVKRGLPGCMPMNATGFFGFPVVSAGLSVLPDSIDPSQLEIWTRLDRESLVYRKTVLRDGRLVGLIATGDIERAGIAVGLMRDEVDVSRFRGSLKDGRFGLISLPRELREERLAAPGGVIR